MLAKLLSYTLYTLQDSIAARCVIGHQPGAGTEYAALDLRRAGVVERSRIYAAVFGQRDWLHVACVLCLIPYPAISESTTAAAWASAAIHKSQKQASAISKKEAYDVI